MISHNLRHFARKAARESFLQTKKILFGTNIMVADDYIRFLEYVCGGGMFEKGNVYLWQKAIDALPPGLPVVEVGAFSGVSTNILTYLLAKQGKANPLFSVDFWKLNADDAP